MQIVSGRLGNETVHYVAPPATEVQSQMEHLLEWLNADDGMDSLEKAALSHVWFETIHPYEDGNGRVGRNMVDLCLARDAGETSRHGANLPAPARAARRLLQRTRRRLSTATAMSRPGWSGSSRRCVQPGRTLLS